MEKFKILFADLDGTLITTKSGKKFTRDITDWKFKPNILEAIGNYKPSSIYIITNQGGIEKRFISESAFIRKIDGIVDRMKIFFPNVEIDYAYCKSTSTVDPNRKPNTGMIYQFIDESFLKNPSIDILMIGDASGKPGDFSDSDRMTAINAGIKYLDVETFINLYYGT